jgi:hypothetical protein
MSDQWDGGRAECSCPGMLRLRAELDLCRRIRSEAVARLMLGAGFLDGLAGQLDKPTHATFMGLLFTTEAADCRAMAAKLREGKMSDIVERLRAIYSTHPMLMEAAARIERLRADMQEIIAQVPDAGTEIDAAAAMWRMLGIARRALEEK